MKDNGKTALDAVLVLFNMPTAMCILENGEMTKERVSEHTPSTTAMPTKANGQMESCTELASTLILAVNTTRGNIKMGKGTVRVRSFPPAAL